MTNEQQKAFWEVIQALNEMNILKHVMVIGSWAEYLYPNILGEEYEPNIRTRDVDLFYWNSYDLIVPEPSAFVLQKMRALPNRVPSYKKEKDVEAIREILIYIKKDERQRELLEHIYSKVIANKKKKKILDGIISEYKIDIITE